MSSLDKSERALYKECYQLARQLNELKDDAKQNMHRTKPTCIEDILIHNLKLLKHEKHLLEKSEPSKVLDHPVVTRDDLTTRFENEIAGAKTFIETLKKLVAEAETDVESKAMLVREKRLVSEEIEKRMTETPMVETTHNDSMMEITEMGGTTKTLGEKRREISRKMFQFLDQHYPAGKEGSVNFVPMRNIIQRLLKANTDTAGDSYVTITEDFWQPHIEVLLRYNVCCRHPSDPFRIRLLYSGD